MRKKTIFLILIAIYPHGQKEEDGGARQIRAKVKAQKAKREKEKVKRQKPGSHIRPHADCRDVHFIWWPDASTALRSAQHDKLKHGMQSPALVQFHWEVVLGVIEADVFDHFA